MAARVYTQKEWRLLSWWLATFHPHAQIAMNVKVGPSRVYPGAFPGDPAAGMELRQFNRWADAVYIEGNKLSLVEAKVDPDPGIFSQLIHYARLMRSDPQFSQYKSWPLEMIALVYNDDPSLRVEAPAYRVTWINYQPNLAELPPASTRPEFAGMEPVSLPHDFASRLEAWGIKALQAA